MRIIRASIPIKPARFQTMTRELPRSMNRRVRGQRLAALLVAGVGLLQAAHASAPPSTSAQQSQIDALASQLAAVQAQLRELAQQNQRLLERQQQLESRLSAQAAANPVPPTPNPVPPGNPAPGPVNGQP